MQRAIDFLASIWRVIVAALGFRDDLLAVTAREPQSERVILAILLLAGMSFLVGRSAILFINQVSPFWFALTVVLSALLFVVRFALWSAAIWFLRESLFCTRRALGPLIRVLGVGSAPFVFGAVILLPYLGPFIARALAVWSFLIVLHAVRYATGIGVHLNLTDGLPLSPPSAVSSLVDRAGRFRAFPTQLLLVVGGHARLTEVEREFRAQIEYLLARGVAPTHLDGHMHVHALPRVLPLVLRLMNEYGIRGMRQPVLSAWAPLYLDARRAARGQRARRKHSQRQQMRSGARPRGTRERPSPPTCLAAAARRHLSHAAAPPRWISCWTPRPFSTGQIPRARSASRSAAFLADESNSWPIPDFLTTPRAAKRRLRC